VELNVNLRFLITPKVSLVAMPSVADTIKDLELSAGHSSVRKYSKSLSAWLKATPTVADTIVLLKSNYGYYSTVTDLARFRSLISLTRTSFR